MELLTRSDLMELLHCSSSTLERARKAGLIPGEIRPTHRRGHPRFIAARIFERLESLQVVLEENKE